MFNHMPPVRLAVLTSLQMPEQQPTPDASTSQPAAEYACSDPDCTRRACKGNRVVFLEGRYEEEQQQQQQQEQQDEEATSPRQLLLTTAVATSAFFVVPKRPQPLPPPAPRRLGLVIVHHKMERSEKGPALEFTLPRDLATATHWYLQRARPALERAAARRAGGSSSNALFITERGKAFDGQTLLMTWMRIQAEHGAPWAPFLPRMNRHVHAGHTLAEMMSMVSLAPGGGGHAHIMGNTVNTWMGSYVPNARNMAAQAAIDQMAAWRQHQVQQVESLDPMDTDDEV
jgi:hypothetical protein